MTVFFSFFFLVVLAFAATVSSVICTLPIIIVKNPPAGTPPRSAICLFGREGGAEVGRERRRLVAIAVCIATLGGGSRLAEDGGRVQAQCMRYAVSTLYPNLETSVFFRWPASVPPLEDRRRIRGNFVS